MKKEQKTNNRKIILSCDKITLMKKMIDEASGRIGQDKHLIDFNILRDFDKANRRFKVLKGRSQKIKKIDLYAHTVKTAKPPSGSGAGPRCWAARRCPSR